jgi:hypothetical protein
MDLNSFTIILYILAIVLLIFGILVLLAPKLLIRISEPLNRDIIARKKSKNVIPTDERVFQKRHIIGPAIILLGIILLYYSYFLI